MTFKPIVEGETESLDGFLLEADGEPFDLTNFTVTPWFKNGAGVEVTAQGVVTKQTQSGATKGKINYAPHTADFTRSAGTLPRAPENFSIRWKVTHNSTGKFKYFPSGRHDILPVYAP